ncbi:hypothetical protein O3G_MSEX002936 [Manduca sexta]|uniref:protein-tyrosine-phosphatase n=1 Tax=Manduca sexta TaxID=7130 RepID=A0A921YR33_MANSE|nr:hypothetical protein O3G_MSEX002936 [Manduca sexta]
MTMVPNLGKCTAVLITYFVCIVFWYPILAEDVPEKSEISATGKVGDIANITCIVTPEFNPNKTTVEWLFEGKPIVEDERINQTSNEMPRHNDSDGNTRKSKISTLIIANATYNDTGNYSCVSKYEDKVEQQVVYLNLSFEGRLYNKTASPIRENLSDGANLTLSCIFEVYKPAEVKWYKLGNDGDAANLSDQQQRQLDARRIESTVVLRITNPDNDNGTYVCEIIDTVTGKNISNTTDVFVYAQPVIMIDKVIGINTTQLFFNWTVKTYNAPINYYVLLTGPKGGDLRSSAKKIGETNTSFVIDDLKKSTEYVIKLEVNTTHGVSKTQNFGKTLDKEPIFVPNISINGFSATSVTIGWAPPEPDIAELIHYYLLEARKKEENVTRQAYHSRDNRNLPYMFDNLEPHTTYVFQVCACSDYTRTCGPMSLEMEAATLDGTPGKPSRVNVSCDANVMNLTWGPPEKPNAEIKGYTMELTGKAEYKDRNGKLNTATWGPLSKFMANDSTSVRFNDLQPNTKYTVHLSAMTRTRRRGQKETKYCTTAYAPPDHPPRPRWRKILEDDKYLFKMYLPRISERNGPLCCYRVYMVRLAPNSGWPKLPPPKNITIVEYEEAHAQHAVAGAYIADIFSSDRFPNDSELVLGDDKMLYDRDDPVWKRKECLQCLKKPRRTPPHKVLESPSLATLPTTTVTSTTLEDEDYGTVETPRDTPTRDKRNVDGDDPTIEADDYFVDEDLRVKDGPLDSFSNYTLFVELITGLPHEEPLFSEYVNELRPAASPTIPVPTSALEIALQVVCVVAGALVVSLLAWCALAARRSRKPPHGHLEMNPLQALRYMVGFRGRQQLIPTVPPDMPPIAKEDLAEAYAERQADSDYGFQKEFEILPDCFPDRTTHASEARENQPKNRYPDIKAYDQTRVKLSQIDSVTGSDYINANYVRGYQEGKQFICAQGPTDATVNDFWRMIWEHGLELIVMLTNLEEYSKVKCSKYWPDEVRGAKAFGNITVHHVGEKRYSDYIVRELKITKQLTNADGQPIVENNGIAKRNGDVKEPSECSAPTSPRELKEAEARTVRQYHFLMWKDFAAPEHPHSILKFIKRMNEAWCNMVGRPVVVHCSAGVGRTGTLVALDCLLDQLRATGHVAVFNTVAELRRQRNFLVQSLKQYVFVYRALVEYAHYGDTEIPASRLKAAVDRLRNTPEGADKCLMEHEFERIVSAPVSEALKSCAAGAAEEVRARNRSHDCLPYDRNRVILTPLPARDFSTYINASFIEAYDNSEGFIITQDPLPNTIMDFWRMVSEHNVSTIVMLSEMGEGKCPRYWDDGTAQYEHISVQYEESESCPYYTRRQFRVINNKSGEVSSVRQLQYQGWPTAPGHVPEVTRGLAELADAADPLHTPTMLVHCQLGTERSSLFVALCILIWQLRVERRVDVCCVARKVRSQRARTIDTFLQYEFLHRAILNYAELHNLLEDS